MHVHTISARRTTSCRSPNMQQAIMETTHKGRIWQSRRGAGWVETHGHSEIIFLFIFQNHCLYLWTLFLFIFQWIVAYLVVFTVMTLTKTHANLLPTPPHPTPPQPTPSPPPGDVAWGDMYFLYTYPEVTEPKYFDLETHVAGIQFSIDDMCESLSVTCRSVVSSGYSGFLHQSNWHFSIIISPPRYDPGCCWGMILTNQTNP